MDILFPRCAGIDIHKRTVVACRVGPTDEGGWRRETRTYGTTSDELLRLSDWLAAGGCTHVGLESTGVYVRRFTARAIPPAGRTGSEGHLWANDSPGGESPRGQQHAVEAGQDRRRVGPGPARPVCYGESCTA